ERPAQGAAGQDAGQVAAIGGRGVNIRVRVDQLAGPARRRLDGGRRAPIALENFLGLAQADGYRPRPRRHETGGRAALPLDDEHGRDAHDGEVAVTATELHEGETGA